MAQFDLSKSRLASCQVDEWLSTRLEAAVELVSLFWGLSPKNYLVLFPVSPRLLSGTQFSSVGSEPGRFDELIKFSQTQMGSNSFQGEHVNGSARS